MLSPNNLRTMAHETLRYFFGISLADLTAVEIEVVLAAAVTADLAGDDVRDCIEECWRRIRTTDLDLQERTLRKDDAHARRRSHLGRGHQS